MDGAAILKEARKLGLPADCLKTFEKAVEWNALAKLQVVEGGAASLAKLLNATGVSAEHADVTRFGIGILAILASRQSLLADIRKMALENRLAEAKATNGKPTA